MIDRQAFARPAKPVYGLEMALTNTVNYVDSYLSLRWNGNAYDKIIQSEDFWHCMLVSLKGGRGYLNTIMSDKILYKRELEEWDVLYKHLTEMSEMSSQYISDLLKLEKVSLLSSLEIKQKRQYLFPED